MATTKFKGKILKALCETVKERRMTPKSHLSKFALEIAVIIVMQEIEIEDYELESETVIISDDTIIFTNLQKNIQENGQNILRGIIKVNGYRIDSVTEEHWTVGAERKSTYDDC